MNEVHQKDEKLLETGTAMTCICPHCLSSMIHGAHVVLEVETQDRESGLLHLSPLLNVFDVTSTIALTEGDEAADLRCSTCKRSLVQQDTRCGLCQSKVARLYVDVDGENVGFGICMRRGCQWHDVAQAAKSRLILEAAGFHRPDRKLIQSGTRLECYCGSCGQDLVQGENLIVHVKDDSDQVGALTLSPFLNDFRSASTLEMPKGSVAADLMCPHCKTSLRDQERHCNLCGAPSALFKVRSSDGDVRIFVCMRRNCHWHHLDDEARAWTAE